MQHSIRLVNLFFCRTETLLRIDGVVLEWFVSYLPDGILSVNIFKALSENMEPMFGILQELISGPLLFLICILPLPHLIESRGLNIHRYVDDTDLLVPH